LPAHQRDSTVAYAWAYAQAVESVTRTNPQPCAITARRCFSSWSASTITWATGLPRQRCRLAFGFTQFWILKEDLLRLNASCSATALMDKISPAAWLRYRCPGSERMRRQLTRLEHEVATLRKSTTNTAAHRTVFSARQSHARAGAQLGLTGLPDAPAPGLDVRANFPVRRMINSMCKWPPTAMAMLRARHRAASRRSRIDTPDSRHPVKTAEGHLLKK